jgi:hypothetical protein
VGSGCSCATGYTGLRVAFVFVWVAWREACLVTCSFDNIEPRRLGHVFELLLWALLTIVTLIPQGCN